MVRLVVSTMANGVVVGLAVTGAIAGWCLWTLAASPDRTPAASSAERKGALVLCRDSVLGLSAVGAAPFAAFRAAAFSGAIRFVRSRRA